MEYIYIFLYALAHVLILVGLCKAMIFNHRLKKRIPSEITEGILFGLQDLDQILKMGMYWWLGALVAAALAGIVGNSS